MTKEEKDIPTSITTDMSTQLMLEKKAIEKSLEQNPIDMDMTKIFTLGLLLGIDKNPDEKGKLMEDLVKVFVPKQIVDVLDKIRLDIAQEIIPKNSDEYDYEAKWLNMGLRMALKVIDKYKAESEGK